MSLFLQIYGVRIKGIIKKKPEKYVDLPTENEKKMKTVTIITGRLGKSQRTLDKL